MTDSKVYFDPKPITDLMLGYLADFGTDVARMRRTYKMLENKQTWERHELDTFRMSIVDALEHFNKSIEELEAEAGVKIP